MQEYPEDVFCARENSGEDEGVCFTKKRIVQEYPESILGKMRVSGVKRFHGVQRHSRHGAPAQMASEIENSRQKNDDQKSFSHLFLLFEQS